jgi:hypothetical protein
MLTRNFILILLLFVCALSFAQEKETPKTAVYIELVGKGFFSANVDFPIGQKSRITLGLTMLDHEFAKEEFETEYPTLTLPTPSFMYLHLFGQERHYFEAGLGFSISPVPWKEYSENDSAVSIHACLGYRYQVSKRFFFRAGLTPFYRIKWAFLPLAGVSLGYSW